MPRVLLAAAAAAGLSLAGCAAAPTPPAKDCSETKLRLSDAEMAGLVEAPTALINLGRIDAAKAVFEAQVLTRDRLERADSLSAMAVALYGEGHKADAVPFLRRSAAAYREALGPDHPEVALALADYAKAALSVSPANPPPDVGPALREALRIRREALGPADAETAASLIALGAFSGEPEQIESGAKVLATACNGSRWEAAEAYATAGAMLAEKGESAGALALVERSRTILGDEIWRLERVARVLKATGEADKAEAVLAITGTRDERLGGELGIEPQKGMILRWRLYAR